MNKPGEYCRYDLTQPLPGELEELAQHYYDQCCENLLAPVIPERMADARLFVVQCNEANLHPESSHYGKDCPPGHTQVEFVGVDPQARRGVYGWIPTPRNCFIDVYVDGQRFNIQVGNFHDGHGQRRGLHIIYNMSCTAERTAVNAASVFFEDER